MTAERPMQPIKKELPLFREATLLVSPETTVSAIPVMERVSEGKQPDPKDVSVMVENVANDLRAQGLPISSEDIRAIKEKAKSGLSLSPSEENKAETEKIPLKEAALLEEIDLNEYQSVIDGFVQNYELNKRAWNKISAIYAGTGLTGQALGTAQRAMFQTGAGYEKMMGYLEEVSDKLKLTEKSPGKFWNAVWKRGPDSYTKADAKGVAPIIAKMVWPLVANPTYWFADRQARKIAGKMFFSERAKLQERVNNRVSDSLYMRNFEFLHDQSSAEMLEIINRGKDATVDLVSVIYEELIPLKWEQKGMLGSQALFDRLNPIESADMNKPLWMTLVQYADTFSAVIKKMILDMKIKPNAQKIQRQRAEELGEWDKVNTKLLTTLQGLETVRTAGNAEAGSDAMYQSLRLRDFVEQGGLREKRMQDKRTNQVLDLLDTALPFASTATRAGYFIKNHQVSDKKTGELRGVNALEAIVHLWGSISQYEGARAEQMALRQSFLRLTHLYTDRIVPDIQDIKRMDQLLGPYDKIDHPQGLLERARAPVTSLKNFDIHVENLKFKNILHNVNLDIPQGSFVTIKGPSGIGKSTLFRHLVNLYSGDEGSVTYGGVKIDKIKKYGDESLYSKIAYANQSPQYFEDMTLRDNLLLWTQKDIPNDRLEGVLRDLRLDKLIDRLDSKEKHFSGGEMRRIGIARALLKDPKVLFLDEPTANLDGASTLQVMKIIQELRKKRPDMTVVAITHDPVFEKIAEKIVDFEKINKKPEGTALGDNQVLEAVAKPS